MIFLKDRWPNMQKGGLVEWIWRLFFDSSMDGEGGPAPGQLPECLQRLLLRGDDGGCCSGMDKGTPCWSDMVDWDVKEKLEDDGIINWCPQAGILYPIKYDVPRSLQFDDDYLLSFTNDCTDLNSSIEFLLQVIETLAEDQIFPSSFQSEELTVIALSNLMCQPIVLYSHSEQPKTLSGIYLPTRRSLHRCKKSPLVMAYCSGHRFVPLLHLCLNNDGTGKVDVPLVDRNLKFLPIKTAESKKLDGYDILLDFLDISVRREPISGLYFFAATSSPITRGSSTDSNEPRDLRRPQLSTHKSAPHKDIKFSISTDSVSNHRDAATAGTVSDPDCIGIRLKGSLPREPLRHQSISNLSDSEEVDKRFANRDLRWAEHGSQRPGAKTDPVNNSNDPKPVLTLRPNHGFKITEISADCASNSQFQRCLAFGCNNIVTNRKTFPLCRKCSSDHQFVDGQRPPRYVTRTSWVGGRHRNGIQTTRSVSVERRKMSELDDLNRAIFSRFIIEDNYESADHSDDMNNWKINNLSTCISSKLGQMKQLKYTNVQ